jgi:hypothetical protein
MPLVVAADELNLVTNPASWYIVPPAQRNVSRVQGSPSERRTTNPWSMWSGVSERSPRSSSRSSGVSGTTRERLPLGGRSSPRQSCRWTVSVFSLKSTSVHLSPAISPCRRPASPPGAAPGAASPRAPGAVCCTRLQRANQLHSGGRPASATIWVKRWSAASLAQRRPKKRGNMRSTSQPITRGAILLAMTVVGCAPPTVTIVQVTKFMNERGSPEKCIVDAYVIAHNFPVTCPPRRRCKPPLPRSVTISRDPPRGDKEPSGPSLIVRGEPNSYEVGRQYRFTLDLTSLGPYGAHPYVLDSTPL